MARFHPRLVSALAVAALCHGQLLAAQSSSVEVATQFGDSVIHLPSGDSIEFQATGPAMVPNEAPGLLVTFYPFFAFQDSSRVRGSALAFLQMLLPILPERPSWVVMRAVNVPAARRNRGSYYPIKAFGVVVEYHKDGRWYELQDTTPAF